MTSRSPIGNSSPNQRSAASSPDTETRKSRTVKKPITSNKDDFMLQEQDIVPIMDNPQRQQLSNQRSIKKPVSDSTISRSSMLNNSPSNGSYSNVSMNDNSTSFNSRNNTPSDSASAVPRVRSIKNSKSTRKSEQLEMFEDDELPPPPSTPPPPSNYSPSPTRGGSINKKNQRQQQQQAQSNQDDKEDPGELYL